MDTLTLPEEGWALAYPSPRNDLAHLAHMPCGWTSEQDAADSLVWRRGLLIDGHRCYGIGTDVLVLDQDGDYAGRIVEIGLFPTDPATVAVIDPLDCPHRVRGQRLRVLWHNLRSLRQRRRW